MRERRAFPKFIWDDLFYDTQNVTFNVVFELLHTLDITVVRRHSYGTSSARDVAHNSTPIAPTVAHRTKSQLAKLNMKGANRHINNAPKQLTLADITGQASPFELRDVYAHLHINKQEIPKQFGKSRGATPHGRE